MKIPRTRVVSLRVPSAEFVELAAEADAANVTVSETLLTAWRDWKSQHTLNGRLERIEALLTEMRKEHAHKFQRLADGLNQLILERK